MNSTLATVSPWAGHGQPCCAAPSPDRVPLARIQNDRVPTVPRPCPGGGVRPCPVSPLYRRGARSQTRSRLTTREVIS